MTNREVLDKQEELLNEVEELAKVKRKLAFQIDKNGIRRLVCIRVK